MVVLTCSTTGQYKKVDLILERSVDKNRICQLQDTTHWWHLNFCCPQTPHPQSLLLQPVYSAHFPVLGVGGYTTLDPIHPENRQLGVADPGKVQWLSSSLTVL